MQDPSVQEQAAKLAYLIRVIRIAFFVSGVLFIYVMIRIPSHAEALPTPTLEWALTIMSLTCALEGFLMPRFLGLPTRVQSQGGNPFQKQFTLAVLSLAFFEAAVLFGFVLHFLGADVRFVGFTVGVGLISQLLWRAQPLPNAADEDTLGPR